ncbi:MAG: hypothetical protein AAF800_07040, partial [Planctomycetota bacterium]
MSRRHQHRRAERLLVVMPTWFGDILMATPTLRALRRLLPDVHLSVLVRENLAALVEGLPWIDEVVPAAKGGKGASAFRLAKRLSRERYDTAVLLPNSFRAAALAA